MTTALIMAGGIGTRLGLKTEKPLVKVGDKTLIEHVIDAIGKARGVTRMVVAVSPYTPRTARKARELNLEVIQTHGKGYVEDFQHAIQKLRLKDTLIISADIPFLEPKLIDRVIKRYREAGRPALSVVTSAKRLEEMGFEPKYSFTVGEDEVAPVGINLVDGRKVGRRNLLEEIFVAGPDLLVNINTMEELRLARRLFRDRKRRLHKIRP